VKTVNLEADFARAAYKRPSATLVGNCQLGSLTTGSPAGHLLLRARIQGWALCVPPLLLWRPPREGATTHRNRRMVAQCTVWPAGPGE